MFQTRVVEKIKTRFVFNNFFSENRAVYEIKWTNMVLQDKTDENMIRRMRIECCMSKATDTH
jgi:hypothetical protein